MRFSQSNACTVVANGARFFLATRKAFAKSSNQPHTYVQSHQRIRECMHTNERTTDVCAKYTHRNGTEQFRQSRLSSPPRREHCGMNIPYAKKYKNLLSEMPPSGQGVHGCSLVQDIPCNDDCNSIVICVHVCVSG